MLEIVRNVIPKCGKKVKKCGFIGNLRKTELEDLILLYVKHEEAIKRILE
jgi:hypothetical protein